MGGKPQTRLSCDRMAARMLLARLLFIQVTAAVTSPSLADSVAWACPQWLPNFACDPVCIVKNCHGILGDCGKDKGCRPALLDSMGCMSTHSKTNFSAQTACMVPDNKMRDEVFNCMIEQHKCIKVADKNSTRYPACRDTTVRGDANMSLAHMPGEWYKVRSWRLGEPIECMSCQKAKFSLNGTDAVVFNSTWWEPDIKGELHEMNVVADMALDPHRGPGKLYNTGLMFGLTYWEPYTIVKDGSQEDEPFIFFYVCGGTLQGNYTTAFAVGKQPHLTPTLHKRLADIAAGIGLHDSDFCTVNNTC